MTRKIPPILILLCLWGQPFASAAPSPLWNEATWFFRTPTSPFPSGQISRKDLEKNKRRTDLEISYQIRWGEKTFKVTSDQILKELQTSSWALAKSETQLMDAPFDRANKINLIHENAVLTVMKSLNYWSQIYDGKKVGWIPTHYLKSVREDRGYFVALIDSYLRTKPEQGAPILSTAAKDSRWKPVRILEEWIEVINDGKTAYLDLAHLAHRSDFAHWAYHNSSGWLRVDYRSGGVIFTPDKKKYLLKDFTAFETDPRKAIVSESIPNGPQLRSRVVIDSFSAIKWTLSRIDGHGEVWWKKDILEKAKLPDAPTLSLQDLLQKDLHSLSLDGKKMSYGLASSHGVYKTIDGKKWLKIQDFGDQDLPVCVHPDGPWFVGSFRSFDQGKTFEPFLRWDLVTELLQNELSRPPLFMKIIKIAALKNSQLEVTIDSGYKKVKMRGHVLGQFWKAVK